MRFTLTFKHAGGVLVLSGECVPSGYVAAAREAENEAAHMAGGPVKLIHTRAVWMPSRRN